MISVSEMKKAEAKAAKAGMDESMMMENAGYGATLAVHGFFDLAGKKVIVFCGNGNNAGDGLVFARHAFMKGAEISLFFPAGTKNMSPLAEKNYRIIRELCPGIKTTEDPAGTGADIAVDAMLGTGLSGAVRPEFADAIKLFNSLDCFRVSIDCPSGLDADTGKVMGISVRPDMTVTFHDVKKGMNEANSGKIVVEGIGIPNA
ncbi:MAG: NAD(P)H-hydrate epimerase [Candidatus Aenigmarchaeota archaeon]|nr:NAD(P)H-hydrate epimerase [Candidatus Aenigmarchaeota archaeon]